MLIFLQVFYFLLRVKYKYPSSNLRVVMFLYSFLFLCFCFSFSYPLARPFGLDFFVEALSVWVNGWKNVNFVERKCNFKYGLSRNVRRTTLAQLKLI